MKVAVAFKMNQKEREMAFNKGKKSSGEKVSVYQIITDRITAMLEKGTVPWRKTWKTSGNASSFGSFGPLPRNLVSGKAYRGVNVFMLMGAYSSPYWLTFNQVKALGGSVKKGEKGTPVIFWKFLDAKSPEAKGDDNGEAPKGKRIPMLRYYTVFNVEQCDGIKHRRLGTAPVTVEEPATPAPTVEFKPVETAEALLAKSEVRPHLSHGGDVACYSPMADVIKMPNKEAFERAEEYYATLFHETVHATGHKSRLDRFERNGMPAFFGSPAYSREELVAEMGASFLCAMTGIENVTLDNSAAYIASWLKGIKEDPKALVIAAAQAQKAVDLITGAKFDEESEEKEAE